MSEETTRTFNNLPKRTGLPSSATREELTALGARYLRTDSFELKGEMKRLEQMQLARGAENYMWKRIIPENNGSDILFEIHLEIYPDGYTRHQV